MRFGELLQRSVLRHAARRYALAGWPVVPGAVYDGERYSCGPFCPTTSVHPALAHWQVAVLEGIADLDLWWDDAPFSVLLATGVCFDVIEVPAHLAQAADSPGGLATAGPIAVTAAGRWLLFVRPGEALRPELAERLDVAYHGTGSWVPAPPTRTPQGRVRWHVHPAAVGWQLPESYPVQELLLTQIRTNARLATFATSTPSLRQAA